MKRTALGLSLIGAWATVGWADGFMTPSVRSVPTAVVMRSGPLVRSPRQEAVLIFDGATVEVILRTHFRAGPDDVAWLIPVPAKPTQVRTREGGLFDQLERDTAPRFFRIERSRQAWGKGGAGGFGDLFGGAGPPQGDGVTVVPPVVVEAAGTAGIFEWVALDARDAGKLVDWLTDNQYAVPHGARPLMERYVQEGWKWLAAKIRPQANDKQQLAPEPLAYTYADQRLVYPLAISRLSADEENEIILYVLADRRYFPGNWGHTTLRRKTIRQVADYAPLLRRMAWRRGGYLFITELAFDLTVLDPSILRRIRGVWDLPDPTPTPYLTRLRALIKPEAMDRDVVMKPTYSNRPVGRYFELADEE